LAVFASAAGATTLHLFEKSVLYRVYGSAGQPLSSRTKAAAGDSLSETDLDYIGTGKLERSVAVEIVEGVARGCALAGISLVGGETAQLSDLYQPGEYDLAGFAVGLVERAKIPNPKKIRPGDVLIGLASSGLHSNGFSLARKVIAEREFRLADRVEELGCTLGEELLRPTTIYAKIAVELFRRFTIKGLANITGGGVLENLPRVMPDKVQAIIERGSWPAPPIFGFIQRQ